MTPEEFYDTEVAPALARLANACGERGMSFVASVEYAPGETGETISLTPEAGIKARMAKWAVLAHGNVDTFMIAAARHATETGHSSIFLRNAGVPLQSLNGSGER